MKLVYTIVGALLILLSVYDIFRTLFLPSGKGLISKWMARAVWSGARKTASGGPGLLSFAGPLSFIASVLSWGALLIVGFTLIYWPRMPGGFSYSPGLIPEQNDSFLDAFYLSIVTVGTLGFGDIAPEQPWLRLIVPLQALIGFLLWTAAISWLLSIYPDLGRRQVFARSVSLLTSAETTTGIEITEIDNTDVTVQELATLTSGLVAIRGDLLQFPITYYFHEGEQESALPVVMPQVLNVAQRASAADRPAEVRLQAARLHAALDDMAETLATQFLLIEPEPVEEVLAAYARAHAQAD